MLIKSFGIKNTIIWIQNLKNQIELNKIILN